MKKRISNINKAKISQLSDALDGINNKVPHIQKTVINFKGRKSSDIAQKAIEILSDRDDLIIDPFMGSGSFVLASVKAGRKIVGLEIDNYTYAADYALLYKADVTKLNELYNSVENKVKSNVMELYETRCCNTKNYISKTLYDPETQEYENPTPNREIVDGNNIKLVFKCPICKKKHKKYDSFDNEVLNRVNRINTDAFPHKKYIENSRINITKSTGADYYDRIFTNRNKAALLLIQNAILELEPSKERDILEQALVSSLSLARIAMYGSSTDILYHVVPYGAQEMNVWCLFEDKVKNFIEFKKEYCPILDKTPESNSKYEIINCSYQDYCENNNKIFDLIYTDFPYTDQVPYLERNQLYRIWLETFYDSEKFKLTSKMLEDEIVLTNAPSRSKKGDLDYYYHDIDKMFFCFNKLLKTNGLAVFTVKLGKNKYFSTLNEIINLARKNGFEYATRIGIDKDDPSLRKQSAYKNTLSKEMIILFEKLDKKDIYWYIGDKNYEFETVKLIYNRITGSSEEINISQTVNYVVEQIRINEKYFCNDDDIERINKIIKDNFIIDISNSVVRIDPNKLYLDIEDKTDLFTKFYNYIPVIINSLLDKQGQFVLDDLYFEIANILCTGNPETINQFLDNPNYANDIMRLVANYCEINNKVYTRKTYSQPVTASAIDISTLDGTAFELTIKKLLEESGFENVINTGGSGDLGVDLLASKTDSFGVKRQYLFQCKRWVADVGSQPIQRLVSERARRNADFAVCVTTSGFTKDGKLIASQQDVEMWDGEYITRELNLYFPNKYYNGMACIFRR